MSEPDNMVSSGPASVVSFNNIADNDSFIIPTVSSSAVATTTTDTDESAIDQTIILIRNSFFNLGHSNTLNTDFDTIYGDSSYKTFLPTWVKLTIDLDNLALSCYHQELYSTSAISKGKTTLIKWLNKIMADITVPFTKWPWCTNWYEWYVKLPQVQIHALYLNGLSMPADLKNKIYDYLTFVTTVTAENSKLPGPKKGPIISTGPNAVYTFFNWYESQAIQRKSLDTSNVDIQLMDENFNPEDQNLYTTSSNAFVDLDNNYIYPLQRFFAEGKSLNGYYSDGSIIFHGSLFTIAYSVTIFPYVELYTALFRKPNVSYYIKSFTKIFHPEMSVSPFFCTQRSTNLYNSILPRYFPNILDNYGISIMPLVGALYVKSKRAYFAVRTQNSFLAAFETDQMVQNFRQWPMWIQSRRLYALGVTYPSIADNFEVVTTPGNISELNDNKPILCITTSSTTELQVTHDNESFVCTLRLDPTTRKWVGGQFEDQDFIFSNNNNNRRYRVNAGIWMNHYTLKKNLLGGSASGVNIQELGIIISDIEGDTHIKIRYNIFNRLSRPLRFAYRDLYNPKLTAHLTEVTSQKKDAVQSNYIVLAANSITTFNLYQTDMMITAAAASANKNKTMLNNIRLDILPDAKDSQQNVYTVAFLGQIFTFTRMKPFIYRCDNNIACPFLVSNIPDVNIKLRHNSQIYARNPVKVVNDETIPTDAQDYNYYEAICSKQSNTNKTNVASSLSKKIAPWVGLFLLVIVLVVVVVMIFRGMKKKKEDDVMTVVLVPQQ